MKAKPADGLAAAEADMLFDAALASIARRPTARVRIALAVSGGADSLALMVLMAAWAPRRRSENIALSVVTVDHRLRPASADESRQVAARAKFLGLEHTTLGWSGDKPDSGIQNAARNARYDLITEHALKRRIDAVMVAHTLDDQAETVLMRLARGSGLDGLAAMAPASRRGPLLILRPFLTTPKARLTATLAAAHIRWIEDPSNENHEFERVRLRAAAAALAAVGLCPAPIALTATRLLRVRDALRQVVDAMLADDQVFHGFPLGYCEFDRAFWGQLAAEFRIRVLAEVLIVIGGQATPIALAGVEGLEARLSASEGRGATLGGCVVTLSGGIVRVEREEGRKSLPTLDLSPGGQAIWDNRFVVSLHAGAKTAVTVRALGAGGLRTITDHGRRAPGIPARALRTLPSFWRGETLVAVPTLAQTMPERATIAIANLLGDGAAEFLGPGHAASGRRNDESDNLTPIDGA